MKRLHILEASILALTVVVAVAVAVLLYNRQNPPPELPPMYFSAAEYIPDKAVYLPGDTLHFTPTFTMGHGGQVDGLRTILDTTTRFRARLCDGTLSKQYDIHTTLDRGVYGDVMTGTPSVPVVIERLPPGRYKVATNIHGYGDQSGQVGHDVYFTIEKPC